MESTKALQDRDRARMNAAKMFLRKHSAVIKKNMLLQSINYRLRKTTSEGKAGKPCGFSEHETDTQVSSNIVQLE